MNGHQMREALHNGTRTYGTHVCSLTNPLTANMQAGLEYDFVFVCNEHMPIDRTETCMICQFYNAKGMSPIVRIPTYDPIEAAMALDGGAQGIVVPYVETTEQVQSMVGAVKYRPIKGKKLERILSDPRHLSPKLADYLVKFNRNNYLIIGVESVAAYENLDNLLLPGVDGIFVGPHDLTLSMEIPEEYDNPAFLEVVDDIIRRCRSAGVGIGVHLSQMTSMGDRCLEFIQKGMNWVLYGADIAMLVANMRRDLQDFRHEMGDTYIKQGDPGNSSSCLTTEEPA